LLAFAFFATSYHQPFFWDTIQLGAQHAHFFYDNNFRLWLLPDEIDSGHFPMFGMYLAIVWKILGKSLLSGHLAMLPVNFLLIYGICRFTALFFVGKWSWVIIILLLAEPALTTQMQLISPDVVLMTSFIWTLYGIYTRNKTILVFSYMVLCLISMRGLFLGVGISSFFIFSLLFNRQSNQSDYFFLKAAIPGLMLSLGYMLIHWYAKNWVGFHQDSPWAKSFLWADAWQMIRNLAVICWRMADHGRIFGIAFLILILIINHRIYLHDAKLKKSCTLFGFVSVPLLVPGIVFSQLTAHRYYMPVYFLLIFGLGYIIYNSSINTAFKKTIIGVSFIALLSGHFWKYPDHIAQGWDCVLMHRPYFSLHDKMLEYLSEHDIRSNEVATFFPSLAPKKFTHLNSDRTTFLPWGDSAAVYVYISSVHNDAPDSVWRKIKNIKPVWYEKKGLLHSGLYRMDDINSDE